MSGGGRGTSAFEEARARFLRSFRRHVAADGGRLDVDAMRTLARSAAHRELVLVPPYYSVAWRMLLKVPARSLEELLGEAPGVRASGRCVQHDVSPHAVNSWSVSLDAIRGPDRGFTEPRETARVAEPEEGYVVLLACPIPLNGGRPRRFWLNPDVLYALAHADFEYQREVVSVGSVGAVWLAYARQASPNEALSWDEIVDEVCRGAPREEALERALRACRRRASPKRSQERRAEPTL